MRENYIPIPQHAKKVSKGEVLLMNSMPEEALPELLHDHEKSPQNYQTLSNIALACRSLGKYQDASNACAKALMINPSDSAVWHNYSQILVDMGEFDAATMASGAAYKIDPGMPQIRYAHGCNLLRDGRWAEGFPLYHSRFCGPRDAGIEFPEYQGEPLDGKRILVLPDGGYGDMFLWLRYLRSMKRQGAHITLWCSPTELRFLQENPWIDVLQCFENDADLPVGYDYWTSYMSLPAVCGSTPKTVPPHDNTAPHFDDIPSNRAGICWTAGESATNRKFRSYELDEIEILRTADVEWQSLVPGKCPDWMKPLPEGDWLDTAKIIANLSLVVSVDSAICHLAGALDRPVWTLLHAGSDWKWLRDRETSVWWPTMKLWRSEYPDDFLKLPAKIARELR